MQQMASKIQPLAFPVSAGRKGRAFSSNPTVVQVFFFKIQIIQSEEKNYQQRRIKDCKGFGWLNAVSVSKDILMIYYKSLTCMYCSFLS